MESAQRYQATHLATLVHGVSSRGQDELDKYLSVDPKKSLPRPLKHPQIAHKFQKIVSMNAGTSETIND